MGERGLLGFRQIIEHGAGGPQRGGVCRVGATSKPKPSRLRVPKCLASEAIAAVWPKAQAGRRVIVMPAASGSAVEPIASLTRNSAGSMRAS